MNQEAAMDFRQVDKASVTPALMRFAGLCETLADGGDLPHRNRFEVRNAPWLFGFFSTVDVLKGGHDYRYIESGDFWRVMLNLDLVGARLSELEACGQMQNIRANYDAALRSRAPRYRTARLNWPNGMELRYERLVVPFAGNDGEVSMLVVAAQCEKPLQELMSYQRFGAPKLSLEFSAAAQAA
jgi:hypothetical protein